MLVILKNSPDKADGRRGIKLARDMAADIVLLQDAVYFAHRERLEGFCGAVYALEEDIKLRGLKDDEIEKGIKKINYDELIDMMAGQDKVVGMF